ncbi:hypothetical protein H0H87_005242, partial [Tephrocybe sp. NHM501043]
FIKATKECIKEALMTIDPTKLEMDAEFLPPSAWFIITAKNFKKAKMKWRSKVKRVNRREWKKAEQDAKLGEVEDKNATALQEEDLLQLIPVPDQDPIGLLPAIEITNTIKGYNITSDEEITIANLVAL